MHLSYRGIRYSITSAISTIPGQIIGKYRGAMLRQQLLASSLEYQEVPKLKYRGASY